jgi:hypothetical protein
MDDMTTHKWEKIKRVHKGASSMYDEWVCRRCDSYVITEPGKIPENNSVDDCDTKIVRSVQDD